MVGCLKVRPTELAEEASGSAHVAKRLFPYRGADLDVADDIGSDTISKHRNARYGVSNHTPEEARGKDPTLNEDSAVCLKMYVSTCV